METDTALVRTDSRVELYAVTLVNLNVTVIIYPRNTEGDGSFGLYHSINYACSNKVGALVDNGLDRLENFLYSLVEFGFAGIVANDLFINAGKIFIGE